MRLRLAVVNCTSDTNLWGAGRGAAITHISALTVVANLPSVVSFRPQNEALVLALALVRHCGNLMNESTSASPLGRACGFKLGRIHVGVGHNLPDSQL